MKYQSPQLGKLTAIELLKTARVLVLKIHVIVGWRVPEKELKDILIDQFTKKIKESYQNINADEFEYAFRQNASVQDWGKNMNLALIDTVISEYLERRLDISRLEEKYKKRVELPSPEPEPMTGDEYVEMNFRIWQVLGKYGMISTKCYDILVKRGKINLDQEEKDKMYAENESSLKSRVMAEKAKPMKIRDDELIVLHDSKDPDRWKTRVFNECKKKAVENYFKTLVPVAEEKSEPEIK